LVYCFKKTHDDLGWREEKVREDVRIQPGADLLRDERVRLGAALEEFYGDERRWDGIDGETLLYFSIPKKRKKKKRKKKKPPMRLITLVSSSSRAFRLK
jgi:hypothetical protein